MVRTHFLCDENDKSVLKKIDIYYDHILNILSDPDVGDIETLNDFSDTETKEYFIKLSLKMMTNLRHITCQNHSDSCIVITTMNIVFKFMFDLEFYSSKTNCCNYDNSLELQFGILRDSLFKIRGQPLG